MKTFFITITLSLSILASGCPSKRKPPPECLYSACENGKTSSTPTSLREVSFSFESKKIDWINLKALTLSLEPCADFDQSKAFSIVGNELETKISGSTVIVQNPNPSLKNIRCARLVVESSFCSGEFLIPLKATPTQLIAHPSEPCQDPIQNVFEFK